MTLERGSTLLWMKPLLQCLQFNVHLGMGLPRWWLGMLKMPQDEAENCAVSHSSQCVSEFKTPRVKTYVAGEFISFSIKDFL